MARPRRYALFPSVGSAAGCCGRRAFIRRLAGLGVSVTTLPLVGCSAVPVSEAQGPRVPRIGYLDSGWPDARQAEYQALRAELARHLGDEGSGFILVPRGRDVAQHTVELLEQARV